MVAQTAMYPGDVVRRHMQTVGLGGKPRIYAGTVDCVRQILQRSGPGGLFHGLPANVAKCIPEAGIQFTVYDAIKTALL